MKYITRFFILFGVLGIALSACSRKNEAETTTVILVRHAEKANDGTEDPPLDSLGMERASALGQALKDMDIAAIYSTPYKRTRQTAEPVAAAANLEVMEYGAHDKAFLPALLSERPGQTVLVTGHSNTVPAMVNQLLGEQKLSDLQEWEYDHLFIVNVGADTSLMVLHYGKPATGGK